MSSAAGTLTRVTLRVCQGVGASMVGRALAITASPWAQGLAIDLPLRDLVVGVEIAQGVDDPEPIAMAYVGAPAIEVETEIETERPSAAPAR